MQWTDEGVVLAARPHGESAAIVMLLTRDHGRHAGLAQGATSQRARGVLQPGNRVEATWNARLADHLGSWRIELRHSHAPELFDDPLKLAGLAAAASVAERAAPEREPHPAIYHGLVALMAAMEDSDLGLAWLAGYVRWELGLLAELGFGLDLERCAVTGEPGGLTHVSPRTGRAVSASAAEPYRDKLLTLPNFLARRGENGGDGGENNTNSETADLLAGLALTGHFLDRHIFAAANLAGPGARARLITRLQAVDA